jgi:hypothetical protein
LHLTFSIRTEVRLDGLVVQFLVVPLPVVVLDVIADEESQVVLSKHDHAPEALPLDRSDKPLGVGIQIWAPRRQLDRRHAAVLEDLVERSGEQRIAVVNQVARVPQEATVILLRDQLAVPAQDRVRGGDASEPPLSMAAPGGRTADFLDSQHGST